MKGDHFQSLVSRALDNDLSPEEFAEFERHLLSSEEARNGYLDFADLHSLLDLELEARTTPRLRAVTVVDVDRMILRQKRRSMWIAAMAAAAVVILSLLGMRLFMIAERAPVLSFQTAPHTEFTLTHGQDDRLPEAMTMAKGSRLRLSRGTVELTFSSGVRSIVSAPADITLHGDDLLFMNEGIAWFRVPEEAIGFSVETEDFNVIDLGTEFGVYAKPGGYDEIHVFKGTVRVDALGPRKESSVLVANEARRNDAIGRLRSIEARSSAFLTSLPQSPPYLYWSFDEAEGFDVKGSHPAAREMVSKPSPADSPPRLVEGKFGSALSLDGEQQSIETDWAGIYGADRPLSAAMWVRIPEGLDLTNFPGILGWGIPGNSSAKWKVFVRSESMEDAPTVVVAIGSGRGMHRYTGRTRLDDDEWHHIAVINNGRSPETGEPDLAIYVDGEREWLSHEYTPVEHEVINSLEEIRSHPQARPLAIGKGPVPQDVTFRGLIDELYIFDGAISKKDIRRLITPTNTKQHDGN